MQLQSQQSELDLALQQKDSLETQILDSQNKFSHFKEEITRLDKLNAVLDDKLIQKERELERLRGELSVMERMLGNIGNRPQSSYHQDSDSSKLSHQPTEKGNSNLYPNSSRDQPLRNIQTSPAMRTYDAMGYPPETQQFNTNYGISNFERQSLHNQDVPLVKDHL